MWQILPRTLPAGVSIVVMQQGKAHLLLDSTNSRLIVVREGSFTRKTSLASCNTGKYISANVG